MDVATGLIQDVLKLPRTERSFIARKLLESLENDESFSPEEMEIFERRSHETRTGSVSPLTLDQLKREVITRMA